MPTSHWIISFCHSARTVWIRLATYIEERRCNRTLDQVNLVLFRNDCKSDTHRGSGREARKRFRATGAKGRQSPDFFQQVLTSLCCDINVYHEVARIQLLVRLRDEDVFSCFRSTLFDSGKLNTRIPSSCRGWGNVNAAGSPSWLQTAR